MTDHASDVSEAAKVFEFAKLRRQAISETNVAGLDVEARLKLAVQYQLADAEVMRADLVLRKAKQRFAEDAP